MLQLASGALSRALALLLLAGFVALGVMPAAAATTGNISGTITSAKNAPIAGAKVTATAPSGHYSATTDAKGFFSIAGVVPDTYTISITAPGYQDASIAGVTVFQDQTNAVSTQLAPRLQTIGRTSVRSTTSAFQPNVPQDTYNVSPAGIKTQLGKNNAVSESNLLVSLPGASLDSSGYPVLRGGRENEEGFQFEGIDYTDAFTSQFVNSLALNNPGQFQLNPGAGDASSGNSGTGVINLLTKRGTRPAFGSLDLEAQGYPFTHQAAFEYGFATPDTRISNYFTFTGRNQDRVYGPYGSDSTDIGAFFNTNNVSGRDIIDNFVYKFGKDQNQSLQLVWQNQWTIFQTQYGGNATLNFKTGDPYALSRIEAFTGLTAAQIQTLLPFYPGQTQGVQQLNFLSGQIQPNDTLKLQYNIAPDAATFISAKFYRVNAVVTFNQPFASEDAFGVYRQVLQGGQRTGFAVDGQRQINDKNLLKFGGKYDFLHPVDSYSAPSYGADFLGLLGYNNMIPDFLPGGYLAKNGFTGQMIPPANIANTLNRQDASLYITDSWTPSSRIRADIGLREDMSNYQLPPFSSGLYAANLTSVDAQAKTPHILEPRAAFTYQMGPNDSIRGSFANSVEFAPIADVEAQIDPNYYQTLPYANLAATHATCGVTHNLPCANYGSQIYWDLQDNIEGVPYQPVRPETFSNYDFSYSHLFPNNIALRLTPFYRRGYNAIVQYATVKTVNGVPQVNPATGQYIFNPTVASNLGVNRTTGVEFYLTKDNPNPGFSGSISATYINEFSNVIPTSASEDFFPTLPAASALLGNQYRVGFLSPFQITGAVAYKSKGGIRINPVVSYNVGYPINIGALTAAFVGSTPYNLPNTNVTNSFGATFAPSYVDPQNPGTVFHPNIAATRGVSQTSAAGGILSAPRVGLANVAFEYNPPSNPRSTFGIYVSNFFNQYYGQPAVNTRWQPVANGIAGPQTGQISQTIQFPGVGFGNYGLDRFGNQPYIISPNQQPRVVNFYYQLAF